MAEEIRENSNFIHDFIDKDLEDGVYSSIQTRFPPEPNGYLHIGHAKAICINFGVKEKYKGVCNLRLDDTNPTKEDTEYVDAIKEDIQWLGFQWDNLYYASDYFDFLFDCAIKLIKKGKAFVCELTPEEMRAYRGTLTEPGKESPYRNHRPLYNWFVDELIEGQKPRQIEFARLNLNYTLTSKRKCLKLVQDGIVSGWDDPRMATLSGMRRRGYPPEAVRDFCERIGVSKAYSVVDFALLEACVREHLNTSAPRAMAVLDPIKLVIDNYPEDKTEALEVEYHPDHPEYGKRTVPFGRELYIERDDFMAEPIKKYRRLYPGNEVRLYKAYLVTCTGYDTDENGNVTCVHATYDPATFGGDAPDGRKVRGTIHWVSAKENTPLTARIYDRLFNVENPSDDSGVNSFEENLNPDSLTEKQGYGEVALATAKAGDRFQFMRDGYFCMDKDSAPGAPVFNRTVALRDSFNIKKNK